MKLRLRDFLSVEAKSKIKAGDGRIKGDYKFFTSSPVQSKFINSWLYDAEALVFGTGGNASVHYVNDKFSTSTDCLVMTNKMPNEVNLKCIYYFLAGNIHLLAAGFKGCGLQHISKDFILNLKIDLPERDVQDEIVAVFDLLTTVRIGKEKQLQKFDDLVKSQFIEMFGTVEHNNKNYPIEQLGNLCVKITDGKHGGCTLQANTGYYFVGAREVYEDEIHYESAPQIPENEFLKDYKRCDLRCGDLVIVNTGATIGKSSLVDSQLASHTLLQKSVALIRTNKDRLLPLFLKYCYAANPEMYRVRNASAQPNLLLSRIKATAIVIPPIELQNEFARFVEQTDKSKVLIKWSKILISTLLRVEKTEKICYNY